jgi:hypothetical protein
MCRTCGDDYSSDERHDEPHPELLPQAKTIDQLIERMG